MEIGKMGMEAKKGEERGQKVADIARWQYVK